MSFYSNLANVALKLLKDKGQLLTISRETSSGFDPILSDNTVLASSFTGYGAAFDYRKSEIDGEIVQAGDIRLLLNATSIPPEINDTVAVNGGVYRVMAVTETSPAGTPVIYTLQLRK